MWDYTSSKWFKDRFGNHTRKTFNTFTEIDSSIGTLHIMWKLLKPEQWGTPLVQEKYQEEKTSNKRRWQQQQQHNNNIVIMFFIFLMLRSSVCIIVFWIAFLCVGVNEITIWASDLIYTTVLIPGLLTESFLLIFKTLPLLLFVFKSFLNVVSWRILLYGRLYIHGQRSCDDCHCY
jgi:hypothetical protein